MAKEYIEKAEVLSAIARSNSINDAYKLVDSLSGPNIGTNDISTIPPRFRQYFSKDEKFINMDGRILVDAYLVIKLSQDLQRS